MRYAIYFAPAPEDRLHDLGSRWLGRDAITGETLPQPDVAGISNGDLAAVTRDPRRYGFHATLKAPFALADDATVEDLIAEMESFAGEQNGFDLDLGVNCLSGFLALTPTAPSVDLDRLAAECVRRFDRFRAPISEADMARRRPDLLTERQRGYLKDWGYPYVFEDFRFHMTLTDRLDGTVVERMGAAARTYFAQASAAPIRIDRIALFSEAEPGAAFRLQRFLPFSRGDIGN
ncbi:DUF1045 domain-containing protein [Oryzibacter oryziterrae]|uniref:DUF1045 domain-containing protein n=1 Tax=Oryzibacter oryziterrae TaxID=2766474 RepID=UPI001F33542E|nr:DUF1045 domain-containing protein [Oryzibacter oryziterrae]